MANIKLPERFKNVLDKNQELDGIIKTTLATFGEILKENKLFFFYEYTNHGIKHIEDVLASSDNLITDETFSNVLSVNDIGYYILSVILHDIGMHLDLEGFKCLINGEHDDILITELDSQKWSDLWLDYVNEARKFSGKQLISIFGDEDTIIRMPPFSKPGEITENDKRLIGEFIRRHHARIAHEIAIKGFPAKPNSINFANSLNLKTRSIIGLIARSHGMNLRKCLDYIENTFGRESKRFPNGIHATYLMIILRIADYIQIDSSRISKVLLKSKTFSSPISKMENYAHYSIDNVDDKWHDDPERIFVTASPEDSKMFIKLKKLFKDIQYEFDISWAVLGELYGNSEGRDKPKIKFRRITSNLETINFINKQVYVADSFLFKTNDEIIKLLVAPLYGDNISFGVRELLQNSIDACQEREFIEEKKGNSKYKSLITVDIQKEKDGFTYFKITDNGLGMDIEIIKNYFLSAGASYRKSLEWRKEFLDEEGKAKIRRSGRFGVGILSAFLIGKEIYIETKKNESHQGYKFSANLNTELINVLKDPNITEGTFIKIKIDENKIKEFIKKGHEWTKWYTLSKPEIKYSLFNKKLIPYKKTNPENNDLLPIEWNSIDSLGYNKILWTYDKSFANVKFTCNGILIPSRSYSNSGLYLNLLFSVPHVSVFDNNAILPLTLDRNSISERLSFNYDLLVDVYKDFIAYLLVFNNNSYINDGKLFLHSSKLNHPSAIEYNTSVLNEASYGTLQYTDESYSLKEFLNTILISKKGFILNYNYFIKKLNKINAVLIQFDSIPDDGLELDLDDRFALFSENKTNSIPDYLAAIEARSWNDETYESLPYNSRIFIKSEKYNFLFNSKIKRAPTWLKNKCKIQNERNGFICLHLDNPIESLIKDDFLNKYSNNIHFIREYEIDCLYEGDQILNNLFQKYIGDDVIIPFSLEERKRKYPLAFKELSRYMEKYSNVKNIEEEV
ncbi:ATP-binding protein [Flavobacterium chungangensis]|uniref:ATP-binding protein n=1 Tax=Flavobacterium chungangensis TaxID=2708132 RepID=A0ABV8ZN14_9FLAO